MLNVMQWLETANRIMAYKESNVHVAPKVNW